MIPMKIWKHALSLNSDIEEVLMPAGAEILCVREQGKNVCVWFRCDPSRARVVRRFQIVGTGHPAPGPEGKHLGTAMLASGDLVVHVFEIVQRGS